AGGGGGGGVGGGGGGGGRVGGGEQGRPQALALLESAVAEDREGGGIAPPCQAVAQRKTRRRGQALPQRAAGVLGNRAALGADRFQRRPVPSVTGQGRLVNQAGFRGHGVGRDDVVARRADHPVDPGPVRRAVDGGVLLGGR